MGKIEHFQQLEGWQEAHNLTLMVYQATKKFAADEPFGLVSQMRRATVRLLHGLIASTERRL
jgi:four helix bundle protein